MTDMIEHQTGATPLTDRERAVLLAVLEQHILTAEPVSSAQLCESFAWGISPATVRALMARLETAGYLAHAYHSAGKTPTAKAYRFFILRLLETGGPKSPATGNPFGDLLRPGQHGDQVVQLTAGVLAALSKLLAITWVADVLPDRLDRIDLLRITPRRILLAAFTMSGREIHQPLETTVPVDPGLLQRVAGFVNDHGRGRTADELKALAQAEWAGADRRLSEIARQALAALQAALPSPAPEDVAVEGAANLIAQPEFNDIGTTRSLLTLLDRRQDLVKSFGAPGIERHGLRVILGEDDPETGLPPLSLVTLGVHLLDGRTVGLGVVGPRRMAYGQIISLLDDTAWMLARSLS